MGKCFIGNLISHDLMANEDAMKAKIIADSSLNQFIINKSEKVKIFG